MLKLALPSSKLPEGRGVSLIISYRQVKIDAGFEKTQEIFNGLTGDLTPSEDDPPPYQPNWRAFLEFPNKISRRPLHIFSRHAILTFT
jgi:hypothetical protein